MAAGMKDVASLAGVAVGTVSNVLNHPDLVRPLTRARVEAAMEQLGFIPNGSARQLRAGRSRCLGLVVLDVTNPFFTEVARGVEDYAQAAGYAVILCNSDEADDKERRYLRVLEEQRVRGILITPVHGRAPELRRIRERGTPVVLLDRPGSAGQCSVAVDDRRGGEIAVSHLLGLGHRRIALVNGPVAIRQCADRRRGALRAVERAGLDPAAVLTEVTVPAMNARAGAAAADELLGRGPRPTAVFGTNDMLALGLLRRLGQAGVAVPGDLAVVGYDDIEFAADAAVPLTSVRQPKYQLGRAAAELLLDEADRPDQHEHRRIVFKPELVARASSGAAASPGLAAPRSQDHGDHRQRELAVRGLRLAAQEVAGPGEQPGPFGLLHDQEVRVRADGGQQRIGGAGHAVPELAHLGRGEQVRARSEQPLLPGLSLAVAPPRQRDAGLALADLGQPGHPADPVVVHVPQPGEHAARPEHPGDLGQRAVHVEPVHGLAGQHGVQAGIGQRDLLGAPRRRTHRGHRPPQLGQHLRVGLHRGHLGAQAGQLRGQLAGTSPDVGDPDRLAVPHRLQRPPDGGLGIAGAVLGVGGRGGAER